MYQAKTSLLSEVEKALKLWKRGIWLRGLALIGLTAAAGLGLMIILRQQWVHFPLLIPILFILTLVAIIAISIKYLFVPLRQETTISSTARSIENRYPHLEDRLVTAVEQTKKTDPTSQRWLSRLLLDIKGKTEEIELNRQLRINGYGVWRTLFIVSLIALGGILLNNAAWQGDFRTMVKSGFSPPKPPVELEVIPGTAHIKKGAALQVKAIFRNDTPESATIFYTENDTAWQSTPLELKTSSGDFNYDFFDVQTPFQYYVKIGDALSDIYDVTVFDAPKIKRIDLTYTYPKYTGLPQRFEPDGGDIWAPVGTTVKVRVLAENAVMTAQMLVGEVATSIDMQMLTDTTAAGLLRVAEDSQYSIRLLNKENLDNAPYAEYYIHAMQDNPASISIKKPTRDTKATMLEEIPVVAEIGNDFGLEYVQLAITVNTRPEVLAPMYAISSSSKNPDGLAFQFKDYRTLLYLEDLNVEIGDFVTYYVQVKDRSQPDEAKSDMYFIDIRNFEDFYNVAESQGSGSAGMRGGLDLSLSQREIITATTRLKRDSEKITQAEYKDRRDRIKDAQEEVRQTAEQIVNMAKMQMNFSGESDRSMVDELNAAVFDMKDAESFLEQDAIDSSLTAQRDAYTHLVRAEMAINQKQLQLSQSSGGGARTQDSDELARLFHDELDELKNKYETLQQGDKSQAQQAVNEAMQKIKELARRQQAINEMSRQSANKKLTDEEKKRRLRKLQRQQEQLRRDTQQAMQQLNESMNKQQQSLSREMMNEMQRASNEMNRASNSLRQQKSQNALSSGQQAQDRLENIEQRLRKSQQNALQDDLRELQNKMQQLADRQKRLADSTSAREKRQASADTSSQRNSQQADLNAQKKVRENLQKSLQDLQQLAQGAEANPEIRRGLRQLNRKMQRSDVLEKMQQAEQAMEKERLDQAERLQRSAHRTINEGLKQLQRLSKGLESSKEEKLKTALQEAQALRNQLENQLQQAGKGQQRPQSDTEAKTDKQQGSRIGNPQSLDRRITEEMIEKWREQIWSAKERLEHLQRQIRADSLGYDNYGNRNDLEDITRKAIDDLSGFVRTFTGGDRQRINEITQKLVDPLRRIEAELEAQLQLRKSQESLRTVKEQPIPPEYKDMVEEYYRSLSRTKGLNRQNN